MFNCAKEKETEIRTEWKRVQFLATASDRQIVPARLVKYSSLSNSSA